MLTGQPPLRRLLCTGIPGAGKTFLAAKAINDICKTHEDDADVCCAYVYCDDQLRDEQTAMDIVASLLGQLSKRGKTAQQFPQAVKKLYQQCTKSYRRATYSELFETLKSVIKHHRKVFLVIDALDECRTDGDHQYLLLEAISALSGIPNVSVLATSRPIPLVSESLSGHVNMVVYAHDEDLRRYVRRQISRHPDLALDRPELQSEVVDSIMSSSQQLFLMAAVRMQNLTTTTSPEERQLALSDSPTTLEDNYKANMLRILRQSTHRRRLALDAFLWIVWAKRALHVKELLLALAIKTGHPGVNDNNLAAESSLHGTCIGMITVEGPSGMVRLMHKTMDDYLRNTQTEWFEKGAHSFIAERLATYLLSKSFSVDFMQTHNGLCNLVSQSALFDSAAKNWVYHAQNSPSRPIGSVAELLSSDSKVPKNCLLMAAKDKNIATVKWLLEHGTRADISDFEAKTALHYAVSHGWDEAIEPLIRAGAPCTPDLNNMTPMHYAVYQGNPDLIKALTRSGISIDFPVRRRRWSKVFNQTDDWTWEPQDSPEAPGNSETTHGFTPLHLAVLVGSADMVEYLLANGANPNALSESLQTPLHIAIKGSLYGTPRQTDMWDDPDYHIESELDYVAESLEEDPRYGDLKWLESAIEEKRTRILRCLLDVASPSLEVRDIEGNLPLHCIRYYTSRVLKVLRSVLRKTTEVSAKNADGQTPLHLACRAGNMRCAKMLIKHDASLSDTDHLGRNAIHHVAHSCKEETIDRMLKHIQDTKHAVLASAVDKSGQNALHHMLASRGGSKKSVQQIIESGADVNGLDVDGKSPLSTYLEDPLLDEDVVTCLLKHGADPSGIHTAYGWLINPFKPLKKQTLESFVDHGVDFRVKDAEDRTISHHVARNGKLSKEVLDYLIGLGLEKDARDINGKTPLQIATEMRLETEVRLKEHPPNEWDAKRFGRTERLLRESS